MDNKTKNLFDSSIIGLRDSFNSLWTEGEELAKKLQNLNERVNELTKTTSEATKEVTIVNKLSLFKEYDRQIVELTRKIELLEKENGKFKEKHKLELEKKKLEKKKKKDKKDKEEIVEEVVEVVEVVEVESEYNSGGEQPPPHMPKASDEPVPSEEEEGEEEGEEYEYKGETYWLIRDSEEDFFYKFITEEEIEDMPCGQLLDNEPVLF